MFNMGGPIKQGIMHGIREPYRGGGAALVGNPVYPSTMGREHHNVWLKAGQVAGRGINAFKNIFGKTGPVTRTVPKQGPPLTIPTSRTLSSKGYPGGQIPGKTTGPGSAEFIEQQFKPNWFGKYLGSSPEVGIAKKLYEGKGFIAKPIKMAARSPVLTAAGAIWAGDRWLWGDGSEVSKDEITKLTEGQHGPFNHSEKKLAKKAQAAFAEAQRDTRVQKYLDLMGYDRSKKTAVADALIDASKVVSDRGTLEKKNITRDLINPIIQATSKRFDKPEQIREAVGLMMVKGEIQKDLEDPQVKKLRALQIEKGEQELGENFETDMRNLLLSRKDKVNKKTLEQYARLTADKYGEPFTQVTEDTDLTTLDNGIYMSEDKIIRVTDGVPQRIV